MAQQLLVGLDDRPAQRGGDAAGGGEEASRQPCGQVVGLGGRLLGRAAQRQVGEKEVMFAAAGGLGRRGQGDDSGNGRAFLGDAVHDVQGGGDGE